ncbi:hypothetical protein ACQ7HM_08075 [Williamsia sp. MIQD14]|uniref:hypothetical protein n=1 Tax=Williamsia sp. MIQD14 TaxID=3425703 RepID=UPI003DA1181C
METVEINAGAWYLRGLRDDDRVSDVYALRDTAIDWDDDTAPAQFVADAATTWADESRFVWAVCEPTTGELVAAVWADPIDDARATVGGSARPGHDDALATGVTVVTRFVAGALGLEVDDAGNASDENPDT